MADDFEKYVPPAEPEQKRENNTVSEDNPFRLGIVGHGFVGKAVSYAFHNPLIQTFIVDPKYDTTIDQLVEFNPECTFICAPTPMNPESGFVDASIVEDATLKLLEHTDSLVVVKSTITPDVVDRILNSLFEDTLGRFVYNPEFLTEKSACEDFVNAEFHVFGGHPAACNRLGNIYSFFSICKSDDYMVMSPYEASFVKYTINSYLALKLTFFNQLYDLVNYYRCSYNTISRAVGRDPRVGIGHTRVPGYDMKRGYGGACLPKDISAFLKFSEAEGADGNIVSFDLLEKVIEINNRYRKNYEVDEREKVNNITFGEKDEHNGQTEEEQQTQDNGSSV